MRYFRKTMIISFLVFTVSYACAQSWFIWSIFIIILSRSNIKEAGDQVIVFNSEAIETNPLVSLSREALFFMAILCGGVTIFTVTLHRTFPHSFPAILVHLLHILWLLFIAYSYAAMHSTLTYAQRAYSCTVDLLMHSMRSLIVQYIRTVWTSSFCS